MLQRRSARAGTNKGISQATRRVSRPARAARDSRHIRVDKYHTFILIPMSSLHDSNFFRCKIGFRHSARCQHAKLRIRRPGRRQVDLGEGVARRRSHLP
ncbi:hypothetical protein EVAR_24164_1 [Eumeta japonica]|uniref:Uncharacterized protein n=1 Tax=Eumeta variegata TaxID=151549 RepID=A0A4C1W4I8_EUMVA|nr:hypothetical protein EVAR_24164_1 [Eumeta japonica]